MINIGGFPTSMLAEQQVELYRVQQEQQRKQRDDDLLTLIELAKKAGLKSLDLFGTKFEFWAPAVEAPVVSAEPENKSPVPIIGDEMPSDEQMLMWSTDGYDEMEAALKDAMKPEVTP